ncbi:aldehyde dehydrogenase family 3 member B1 [Gonapodya prolifera JEL478]|uniref:Aldehyde dehydrogenase n=1 Tax=Gonapodya prolifera (strain JEL478) TaxID=1344416 RepID=A0A139ARX4_GONPJ|nr:aldehyde dehydrogenase family 3 member B1 [Gonapodya prolifera JEL478]|eukprot:KXS19496.1 aldehyde dehydrogenase family 3 member B1 [Gonapodya prolifera JEL478]
MADPAVRATPIEDIEKYLNTARLTFNSGRSKPIAWRKQQLRALYRLIDENRDKIVDALQKDFRKPTTEATVLMSGLNHIVYCLENLPNWMKPEYPKKGLSEFGADLSINHEPFGVCLIIAPWNYPFELVFKPLTSAIAAGNVAVLKPSEITVNAANVITELIPMYLDNEAFFVVNGGVPETTALLERKFDHITYTGSTAVGKIIMSHAAKHLTPVILELGGKSPVVIDPKLSSADVARVCRRLVATKFFNAGQTCVAPDYVLCPPHLMEPLTTAIRENVLKYFGEDASQSPDFARIVNTNHTRRIGGLIDRQKVTPGSVVITGGKWDEATRYVEPTVIAGVRGDGPLMEQEIFGPALPIVQCAGIDEAIEFIRDGPHARPLALYVFTKDKATADQVHGSAVSGSVVINDATFQYAADSAPFGGIGASGMGTLHGKYGFMAYTHHKTVLAKPLTWFADHTDDFIGRFPPYSQKSLNALEKVAERRLPSEKNMVSTLLSVAAAGLSYLAKRWRS